jgi:hypothetical protein
VSTSDPEEVDTASYGNDEINIRSHLALAMMGVDDDANSQCSVDILSSVDMPIPTSTWRTIWRAGSAGRLASKINHKN